jgi:biotin carboxyl carrier protein
MEEVGAVQQPVAVSAPAAPAPVPEPEPQETPAPVATSQAGVDAMVAPMPGTVLKILVKTGDAVQANQPLLILEAMKMENEIVANQAGTVNGIHVTQGQVVNPGEPLLTIK